MSFKVCIVLSNLVYGYNTLTNYNGNQSSEDKKDTQQNVHDILKTNKFEARFGSKNKNSPFVRMHLCRCSISKLAQYRSLFMYAKFHAFNPKCKVFAVNYVRSFLFGEEWRVPQSARACFTWSYKCTVVALRWFRPATSTSSGHVWEDKHRRKIKIHLLVSAKKVYRCVI